MNQQRADIYTRITAEIATAIENGAGEWRMPWNHDGSSIARPRNVISDKGYRGINVLALWVAARPLRLRERHLGHISAMVPAGLSGAQGREGDNRRILEADGQTSTLRRRPE
jgi:hypothetical protein